MVTAQGGRAGTAGERAVSHPRPGTVQSCYPSPSSPGCASPAKEVAASPSSWGEATPWVRRHQAGSTWPLKVSRETREVTLPQEKTGPKLQLDENGTESSEIANPEAHPCVEKAQEPSLSQVPSRTLGWLAENSCPFWFLGRCSAYEVLGECPDLGQRRPASQAPLGDPHRPWRDSQSERGREQRFTQASRPQRRRAGQLLLPDIQMDPACWPREPPPGSQRGARQ